MTKFILRYTVSLLALAMLSACRNVETSDFGSLPRLGISTTSIVTQHESHAEAVHLPQPQISSRTSSPVQTESPGTVAQSPSTAPACSAASVIEHSPFVREDYWLVSHYTEEEMQMIDPFSLDHVDEYHYAQLFSMVLACYHSGDFPNAPHHSGKYRHLAKRSPMVSPYLLHLLGFQACKLPILQGVRMGNIWACP